MVNENNNNNNNKKSRMTNPPSSNDDEDTKSENNKEEEKKKKKNEAIKDRCRQVKNQNNQMNEMKKSINSTSISASQTLSIQRQQQQQRKQTMEDFFYQKMYSDLSADVNGEKPVANKKSSSKKKPKKPKYKSYHTLLLEKSIDEAFKCRGKMQKYVDYNAYNSDDDSDDENDERSSSLFHRYGLESRMWNEIAMQARSNTDELPKWSKHVIAKKEANKSAAIKNTAHKTAVNINKKSTPINSSSSCNKQKNTINEG